MNLELASLWSPRLLSGKHGRNRNGCPIRPRLRSAGCCQNSYTPKLVPLTRHLPSAATWDTRAGVSQQVPKGCELRTALGHRGEGCSGHVGWYLVFQLPIFEKSQLVLPLQVVPIQVPKINLPREHSVKIGPKSRK